MSRNKDSSFACPQCKGNNIAAYYSNPLRFECATCKICLIDDNDPGIPVMTTEQAHRKRPGLYGEAVCSCCTHAPHDSLCEFCEDINNPKPHTYKFRIG